MEHFRNIPRTPVSSSNLAQVGYDAQSQTLTTQFRDGSIYAYQGVPSQLHADLLFAKSKGNFHRDQIRGKFPSIKVRGQD